MKTSTIIAAVAVAIAVVSMTGGLVRSGLVRLPTFGRPDPQTQRAEASAKEVRPIYEQLQMTRATEVTSEADLDETLGEALAVSLGGATDANSPAMSPAALAQLRQEVVGRIYRCWWEPGFDEYEAFMRSRGYRLQDMEGLIHWCAIDLDYPFVTGKPWDPTMTPRDAVRALWDAKPRGGSDKSGLRAFCTDAAGARAAFAVRCPGDLDMYPVPGGPLGEGGWIGEQLGTLSRYYEPVSGRTPQDLLAARQCVRLATIGVVVQAPNGEPAPFLFRFWFDDEIGRWILDRVGVAHNTGDFGRVYF